MCRAKLIGARTQLISLVLVLALFWGALPASAAPSAQSAPSLQDCSTVAEDTLQGELNVVTQQVFADALRTVDLDAIVGTQWVTLQMDPVVDAAVDRAVERVKSETDLWNKFLSGWSPDKAKELTLAVATYTFGDPAFRAKMDDLSAAVSQDVAARLALASADSVSAALYCLQTFIGTNYSRALVNAFEERVQAATTSTNLVNSDQVSPDILKMVGEHQMALGGVGVIIAAQITRKIVSSIAQRISERVAGRIVGRILGKAGSTVIPLAGWIIGTGMIVYDLYESRDGALPQVQESIKSPPVKAGIRSEIAASIRPELEAELPELARSIANDLYTEWRTVKRNIRQVLDLAAQNDAFAAILGNMQTTDQVSHLVDLVGIVTNNGGQDAVNSVIADGSLEKVASLPAGAVTLVQETGSLQTALDWQAAVGGRLNDVVTLEIYKHQTPDTIDLVQLDALLALGDKTVVSRLALLAPPQVGELLKLSTETLVALANQYAPDELAWLATVLSGLPQEQRNALVARILSQPATLPALQRLGNGEIQQVVSSGNLDAAITFITGTKDAGTFWADVTTTLAGGVSPTLFAAKHGIWPATGAAGALVLILLIALRLIYGMGAWLFAPLSIFRRRR